MEALESPVSSSLVKQRVPMHFTRVMATIKPIERKSVHQIQSGQVIGDGLTSVVKELVENSFDANATSIEVRFKNYGLDSIEVVDNGIGITPDNYESVALKHWTSKLTSYDDLDTVTTFGFRGEALSSLCALSDLQITTATANEAPKGTRLEFGASGKLKSRSVVAAQRGTTVLVENIFKTLPVRRKELERNIKREYTKVLGILQAYAGICVGVKFSVFNQPSKGRKTPVFATKGNPTTRENIANVFGAKTLTALVALDLQFEMKSTRKGVGMTRIAGGSESKEVKIVGHISRPIVGEGRQAPDRQMFFVNGRPCILPQISKAFNEVYKSFNVTQSPFIFADILMDTNAYDVNVSPDKRSILLHDQIELLESLKTSLIEMFTNHEQTVPHAQLGAKGKLPTYKQLTLNRPAPSRAPVSSSSPAKEPRNDGQKTGNCAEFLDNTLKAIEPSDEEPNPHTPSEPLKPHNKDKVPLIYKVGSPSKLHEMKFKPTIQGREKTPEPVKKLFGSTTTADEVSSDLLAGAAEEFERDEPELPPTFSSPTHPSESYTLTAMTSPFSKLSYHSPRRPQASKATIKIGDRDPVTAGSSPPASPSKRRKIISPVRRGSEIVKLGKLGQPKFSSGALNRFAAPGVQVQLNDEAEDETEDDGGEAKEEDGGGNKRQEGCGQDIMILDDEEEGGTGRQGGSMQDIMVLDVDEYIDEDLEEIFKDASQLGEITADGEVGNQNDAKEEAERGDLGQASSKPLFLPSEGLYEYSGGEAADEGAGKRAEDEEPEPINNTEDEDLVNESEHLKQSSIRAQKLLEEAEEAAAKPTSKNLERAFEILEGSRAHSTENISRTYSTSMTSLRQQSKSILKFSASVDTGGVPLSSSALNEDDVSAEERLNLTITKKDFFEMQIKGQFNKGFILATRGEDLFIIDQHASDEKYNFETLQQETVVQNQRLVVPKTLELMAMDEVIVTEHLDVFKKNGFIIEVDPEAPTGARCRLISLPLSKETVFGIKDLEELIHLVHENQGNSSVRCSKIRSMFAMRACKKSTKVGRALTAKGMEKIVRHMGELDKPWNCPHGRPTMRHLTDLGQVVCWSEYDSGQGGLGGLQWGGQNWADTWCAMLDSSDNEGGG